MNWQLRHMSVSHHMRPISCSMLIPMSEHHSINQSNDHLILPRGSNLTSVSILTQSQQFDGINPSELHQTSACCHTQHYQVPDITNWGVRNPFMVYIVFDFAPFMFDISIYVAMLRVPNLLGSRSFNPRFSQFLSMSHSMLSNCGISKSLPWDIVFVVNL